jgi:hypothetical protein
VVPRVLALVALAGLLASPVQAGISRLVETRADVEALAVTEDPEAFVELQRRLSVASLADPTPPTWSQWWFGSHPTLPERVALAGTWRSGPQQSEAVISWLMVSQDPCRSPSTPPPKTKMMAKMTRAMPAIMSPYSTAEAPC